MRIFIIARHAESAANAAGVINSDPAHQYPLTPRGYDQARLLGRQLAHVPIDLAVCTRFLRTRQTAQTALGASRAELVVEPALDEVQSGTFDGAPVTAYWAWKDRHSPSERFPGGESIDDALARYTEGFRTVVERDEGVTLIVCHELAVRCVVEASGGTREHRSHGAIANAVPYLYSESALRRAIDLLDADTESNGGAVVAA
jgi:broad specificity phosphatase PhoE